MNRALWAAAGQGCAFALQLCGVVYIARSLGPGLQGEFATIRSAVFVGEALIWLGLNSGVSFLTAKDPARYLHNLFRISIWHLILGCGGVLVIGLAFDHYNSSTLWAFGLLSSHLLVVVCWLFCQGILQLSVRILLATRLYFWANVVSSSSAGLGLLLVLLVPGKLSLEMTLLTQIIATFSAALFGVILIARKHGQIEMFTCRAWLDWATGLRAGANGLASTIAFMGLYRIDLFLVVTFCDKKTSGIYAVASFTVEALQRASDWFAAVLTPMVASGLTNGHKEAFRNSGLGMGIVLGAGLIGCSFVMAGYDPFRASMGVEFSGVSRLVWLLIPKACLHCIMVSYAAVLAGRGYTFYHPASGVGAMVVLLLLGLILGPAYGPLGVIASLTVAYLVSAVIMILGTRNTLVNRPASAT